MRVTAAEFPKSYGTLADKALTDGGRHDDLDRLRPHALMGPHHRDRPAAPPEQGAHQIQRVVADHQHVVVIGEIEAFQQPHRGTRWG